MNSKLNTKLVLLSIFSFLSLSNSLKAQESFAKDTLYPVVEQVQSDLTVLKKLKVSGYVQAQYQVADTAGISSFSGGNFSSGIDNRFMVRRGRIKFAYENELSKAIVQFDITEKGLGIKDAYLSFTEPWLKSVSVTGGVFDRPFGYEISYSSSSRETPERSRIFQTLFPGERENGAKLTLQAPKTSALNFIRLDAGIFNGNGPAAVETDSYKDFICHLGMSKTSKNETFRWGLGGSYYNGGFASTTTNNYTMKEVDGVKVFLPETIKKGDKIKREYIGIDAQLGMDWALGLTQIRAEYLMGTQPATAKSSSSLTGANTTTSQTADLTTGTVSSSTVGVDSYTRNFNGYYVYFIQDILKTPVQLVVKYDLYDPNTDVDGDNIGKTATGAKATADADVKYSTLGLGLNYRWNSNVKIMAYYDIVKNETTELLPNTSTLKDLSKDRKDNVFTLRVQYKF